MIPVVFSNFLQTFDDVVIIELDGKFTPASKLPGARLTDPMMARASSASIILACSFRPFSLCTFAPTSFMIRRPPTPSISLSSFSECGGRDRMRTFNTARDCAHDTLDDHRILVSLVLQPQRVFGTVDEMRKTFAAVVVAPDQVFRRAGVEWRPVPVGVETLATSATSCLCFVTTA